jgi:hypothetical protein
VAAQQLGAGDQDPRADTHVFILAIRRAGSSIEWLGTL